LAAADETKPVKDDEAARPVTPARARRLWWWIGAAIALVAVILVALPVYSTLQPEYYERYPALKVRMDNWRNSTHAKVSCAGCHVDPGPIGFLTFAAKSIPDFYSQLLFGPKSTNLLSAPHTAACQKCHTNYRQVSPNGDLIIPHRAHVAVLKIDCPVCHKNLVHSLNSKGFNSPQMTTCLECHNGTRATNKCVKCHTRKEVPPSHKRKDWLQIHSQQTKTVDCSTCHGWSPDYCAQCHKQRPASHTATWKKDHAVRARENPKRCLVCHTQTFCKKCH
jgi:hypothetical protein